MHAGPDKYPNGIFGQKKKNQMTLIQMVKCMGKMPRKLIQMVKEIRKLLKKGAQMVQRWMQLRAPLRCCLGGKIQELLIAPRFDSNGRAALLSS